MRKGYLTVPTRGHFLIFSDIRRGDILVCPPLSFCCFHFKCSICAPQPTQTRFLLCFSCLPITSVVLLPPHRNLPLPRHGAVGSSNCSHGAPRVRGSTAVLVSKFSNCPISFAIFLFSFLTPAVVHALLLSISLFRRSTAFSFLFQRYSPMYVFN